MTNLPTNNASVPPNPLKVKVKDVVYTNKRKKVLQVQLQGEQTIQAMETRCKKLGMSQSDWIRELVEKDLVAGGELPEWWFTRS